MLRMKLTILLLICICTSIGAEEIPGCDYFDTVDLTYSEKLTNGSYKYEGVVIPLEQTGTYNYKILFEGTKITVEDHLRGCVCKFKPCIRYCCHRHRLDLDDESKCTKEFNDYTEYITLEDGTQRETSIRDQFVLQPGIKIQCKDIHLVPYTINNHWKLFENGAIYRSDDNVYLSKRDYCLQPKELDIHGFNYRLWPINCLSDFDFNYVNWMSNLFLLLTICIYVFVIKLQHAYDKCCLCYLICFLVSQLIDMFTAYENFLWGTTCYIVAYLVYFFTISAYLWIAVMSFEFFRIFVTDMFVTNQHNNQWRFLKYCLFVWGMASALLLITILADYLLDNLDIDTNWKVGFGYYECYLKMFGWSKFVYLIGPATLMLLTKAILMIATVWHVHIENRKNRKQLEELGTHNTQNSIMFSFYLRILLTEILNWLIELCYILYNFPIDGNVYYYSILSHLIPIYCILIFAITVTRKDVRKLFARR